MQLVPKVGIEPTRSKIYYAIDVFYYAILNGYDRHSMKIEK